MRQILANMLQSTRTHVIFSMKIPLSGRKKISEIEFVLDCNYVCL